MNITLPDGSIRELETGSTGFDLASSIGPGLAKAALAVTVNGVQKDLNDPINEDSKVSIITIDSDDGLEIMRHTLTAQVLARAVRNLFPGTKLAIGPTITDGFYYDFEFTKPISPEDLGSIEKEMKKIISSNSSITKKLNTKQEAIEIFKKEGESYKESIINASEQQDGFQLYYQDDSKFVDLCRGPHIPNFKHIGAFKLLKIAGAYWKGDSNNKMLTRIYGTAWKNEKDLSAYLERIEEAEKRDHRRLGKEMNLFHFQEEAPGMVFWHPDGWTIYRLLESYMRSNLESSGYKEIKTPQVLDRKLWEASGHWDKYRENMFITEIDEEHANEKRVNALKPMNCPCHVQIYNQGLKSYRDLPLRLAEFGSCHRYEASGTMHGLMRVRGFTQDDGHIFCTEEQIESETGLFIELLSRIYKDLGFEKFDIKLSTRPEIRVGSDEVWDKAEHALESAIKNLGLPYQLEEGGGAFYGPNEKRVNALKPMNCPCHVQIYNQGLKSYRDLPLRLAEFGSCHRYEASGTMHGLMRVRGFTQDDGHIFCTEEQIESETGLFIELLSRIYKDLGFEKFDIKLSTRPEIRVGSDEVWDKAEHALESAIKNLGLPYQLEEGGGAFYGPKLDFVLTDAIGREWQCGTFQADFNLPERLDAEYVGEDGSKHRPVMIHRAILGSFERFIGVLIENYSGKLPFWLAPVQVVVATIISDADEYANEIIDKLSKAGIRCNVDLRNEKISYKVREHSSVKVPVIIALGKREQEDRTVSIRRMDSDKTEVCGLEEAINILIQENTRPQ